MSSKRTSLGRGAATKLPKSKLSTSISAHSSSSETSVGRGSSPIPSRKCTRTPTHQVKKKPAPAVATPASEPVRRQRAADRQATLQALQAAQERASPVPFSRTVRRDNSPTEIQRLEPIQRRSSLSLEAYFRLPLKRRMQVNDGALEEDLAILRAAAAAAAAVAPTGAAEAKS